MSRRSSVVALGLSLLIVSGCAQPHNTQRRYAVARYAAFSAGLTPQQQARFDEHCGDFGCPEKVDDFGRTYMLDSPGYVLEYAGAPKIAVWAAEHVTKDSIKKDFPGEYNRPAWKEEDRVPEAERALDSDYPANGDPWQRGHLAPNADFGSKARRNDTFVLSNAVPQHHLNNPRIWEFLEGMVRDWVNQSGRGEAYIVTGGFLYDPTDDPEVNPTGAGSDGIIWYDVMGESEVMIPTHLFKIIVTPKPGAAGKWEAIAFALENREYAPDPGSNSKYRNALTQNIHSVDWLETRTGLNFFSKLAEGSPDEATLERSAAAGLWPN